MHLTITTTIPYEGTWSVGVLLGVPAALIVLAVIIGFGVYAFHAFDPGMLIGAVVVFIAAVVAILSPLGFYPYAGEYHKWINHTGAVAQIDKRLVSSGDSMQDKFVVQFKGSGQQYGCDDTRCSSVRVGDQLTLSCKRAWQYTGTDGYDCRFVSTEANR